MKNVLFATTALVGFGFAGSAFADAHTGVALSGSAEMGVTYYDDGTDDRAVFHNDIDVTFTLSGATDNGSLTFGATIDLDEVGDGDNLDFENSVFVSGDFGTLSMGDVDSAYDKAHIEIPAGGLSDEADQASGGDPLDGLTPEQLRYDYSFGDLTVSASLGLADQQPTNDEAGGTSSSADDSYAVGVAYGTDLGSMAVSIGLGYIDLGSGNNAAAVSASVGFGDLEVIGSYQMTEVAGVEDDVIGVGATYSTGALGIGLGYETSDAADIIQGYVTYDLTGGAELVAAASLVDDGAVETTRAGFGIGLGF